MSYSTPEQRKEHFARCESLKREILGLERDMALTKDPMVLELQREQMRELQFKYTDAMKITRPQTIADVRLDNRRFLLVVTLLLDGSYSAGLADGDGNLLLGIEGPARIDNQPIKENLADAKSEAESLLKSFLRTKGLTWPENLQIHWV